MGKRQKFDWNTLIKYIYSWITRTYVIGFSEFSINWIKNGAKWTGSKSPVIQSYADAFIGNIPFCKLKLLPSNNSIGRLNDDDDDNVESYIRIELMNIFSIAVHKHNTIFDSIGIHVYALKCE